MFAHTTHATLLRRLSDGVDPQAWNEFQQRYGELIRGFSRRRGLQLADAEDVMQDVMMALVRTMPGFQYDPAKGKFRGYLKAAALHAIYKRLAMRAGAVDLERIEHTTRAAAQDDEVEESWELEWRQYHVRLANAVIDAEFNAADRAAFRRYAVEGADVKSVAAELGLTADQVYQAKSRILKRLSQQIELQVAEEG